MCVVNAVLKRTVNNNEPIKSKERLIIQCGYRRFIVNPVFSQHTNGKKHKVSFVFSSKVRSFYTNVLVRTIFSTKLYSGGYFLCPDPVPTIASFVLQRSWGKAGAGGTWKFAVVQPQQTCNQKSCFIRYMVPKQFERMDFNFRISGHPLKVLKRSAVIRFMFFNREDIVYFKSVKLRTKCGRIGHIKEPLGK